MKFFINGHWCRPCSRLDASVRALNNNNNNNVNAAAAADDDGGDDDDHMCACHLMYNRPLSHLPATNATNNRMVRREAQAKNKKKNE